MQMEEATVLNTGEDLVDLPPGFRFHPTDEEIITHYLTEKVMNGDFSACAIGEVDLNKCEPWDMPKKAKMGEKEWYFFCQRDRKYPTGMRTNRATEAGYWKATGKDKEIYRGKGRLVGMKKTLVFYRGRAPKGDKTNWVMHEYRLEGKFSYYTLPKAPREEWVVCRVFHKSTGIKKSPVHDLLRANSFGDADFLDSSSLPPLMETPVSYRPSSSSFNNEGDNGNDNNYEFKQQAIASSRSSDGNYFYPFSTSMINNNNQDFINQPPNGTSYQASFYPHQILVPNPLYTFQDSPSMPASYLHQENSSSTLLRALTGNNDEIFGLKKQCKVEQFSSNQSMVSLSQDTGLSTEMNNTTEISSVVSKKEIGSSSKAYEDLDQEGPSVEPIADLECLWDY